MSTINIVPASTTFTIEQLNVSPIYLNISDTSCSILVSTIDTDSGPIVVSTKTLLLSGTDFTDNINIPAIKTWICSQLGYTES
jgi:hypothetical protein